MISIGFSTRKSNPDFIQHIQKTVGLKNVEIFEVINNGEKSLTSVYNEILENSKNDIVVLCHDDIFFNTQNWGNKLLKHFEKSNYGILGVAGTTSIGKSGVWWEDRSKAVGIVRHRDKGKEWETKYSSSLYGDIEPTIIVDGLFLAINKKKIYHKFDETFSGFHFYDLSFCFENFLSGVEIGVIYNINLTHLSIGITNEKWEENRAKFVDKYKENLPKKLNHNGKRPLKVLISCLSFKNLTGSELYVYELAKNLKNLNCDVTILSNIGNPLQSMIEKFGVKCVNLSQPPGYKLGDGNWGFQTQNGFEKSKPNVLYKEKDVHYDIIHSQHKPITEYILNLYPNTPKICTIHSEIINLEMPVKHDSIKHYIAIRPSIKDYIKNEIDVTDDDISLIYNPIDSKLFNQKNSKNGDYYLFVGTIDYLRINSIRDIIKKSKEDNKNILIIGDDTNGYLKDINGENIKVINPTWVDLPKHVKNCYKVVGIKLGRTTIEGWMCGKNAIIYDVDNKGNILDFTEHNPPEDLFKYNSENVVLEIYSTYKYIINKI